MKGSLKAFAFLGPPSLTLCAQRRSSGQGTWRTGLARLPPEALLAESVVCKKEKVTSKIHLLVPTTAWRVEIISVGVTIKRQEEEHIAEQLEHGARMAFKTPPVRPGEAGHALACTQSEL